MKRSFQTVHVLHRVDSLTWSWDHPTCSGDMPGVRSGHGAVKVDDHTILIHGGWDPQGEIEEPYSDAYVLDIGM